MNRFYLLLITLFLLIQACKLNFDNGIPQGKYLFKNIACNQKLKITGNNYKLTCNSKTGIGNLKKILHEGQVIKIADSLYNIDGDTLVIKGRNLNYVNGQYYYKKVYTLGYLIPSLHKLQGF